MHHHLIWTTYGTWLPGDERGWLRSGVPAVQPPDPATRAACHGLMREEMVLLDDRQIRVVTETIMAHCQIRGWILLAVAAKTNHIHVVVESDRDGNEVRDQLKAWCSRRLSDLAGLAASTRKSGRRRWFTEGAYVRQIEHDDYLREAVRYVEEQREVVDNGQ